MLLVFMGPENISHNDGVGLDLVISPAVVVDKDLEERRDVAELPWIICDQVGFS